MDTQKPASWAKVSFADLDGVDVRRYAALKNAGLIPDVKIDRNDGRVQRVVSYIQGAMYAGLIDDVHVNAVERIASGRMPVTSDMVTRKDEPFGGSIWAGEMKKAATIYPPIRVIKIVDEMITHLKCMRVDAAEETLDWIDVETIDLEIEQLQKLKKSSLSIIGSRMGLPPSEALEKINSWCLEYMKLYCKLLQLSAMQSECNAREESGALLKGKVNYRAKLTELENRLGLTPAPQLQTDEEKLSAAQSVQAMMMSGDYQGAQMILKAAADHDNNDQKNQSEYNASVQKINAAIERMRDDLNHVVDMHETDRELLSILPNQILKIIEELHTVQARLDTVLSK